MNTPIFDNLAAVNAKQSIIDAIDQPVNDSLASPIVDNYDVNRYEKCDMCGGDWHGLPEYTWAGRSCPGGWASDEAKAVWRNMFSRPTEQAKFSSSNSSNWMFTDVGAANMRSGRIDLDSDAFKVALFDEDSNISRLFILYTSIAGEVSGGGYTAGGIHISFATSQFPGGVEVCFTTPPVWRATGRGFMARHVLIYHTVTRETLCFFDIGRTVTVTNGDTLTIDGDPVFRRETTQ
jgi:hypothetical protein